MRLNRETRRWHRHADEPWLRLLRPDVDRDDYVAQLARVYGFEAPLEAAYGAQLGDVIDLPSLARADLIALDLLALGLAPAELARLPRCDLGVRPSDPACALGWLYVVERSALHHERVHRHLALRLPEVSAACAYLGLSEGVALERWQRFGEALGRAATTAERATLIVDGAHAGFACMRRWFFTAVTTERSAG